MSKTILCLASDFKGSDFIRTCYDKRHEVILLMQEHLADSPWPWDCIDEHYTMPDFSDQQAVVHRVSELARDLHFDAIVTFSLNDSAVAAALRRHLRISRAEEPFCQCLEDSLAMRTKARKEQIQEPSFVHVLNYDRLQDFMAWVPSPWLLRPRYQAASSGVYRIENNAHLWRTLEELGDQQSYYILEQFISGDVYHVQSITYNGKVVFTVAHKSSTPVIGKGQTEEIAISHTMLHNSAETLDMVEENEQLIKAFGLGRGITHAEFVKNKDGEIYLLDFMSQIGESHLDQLVHAATGLNLWEEWAKLELSNLEQRPYQLPSCKREYAGLIYGRTKEAEPDLSSYDDAEIVERITTTPHQAGVIVAAKGYDHMRTLLHSYQERFLHDLIDFSPPAR